MHSHGTFRWIVNLIQLKALEDMAIRDDDHKLILGELKKYRIMKGEIQCKGIADGITKRSYRSRAKRMSS